MTMQEIINKVWDWFIVQKQPPGIRESASREGWYNCALRGSNGGRCAIGVLILDANYKPEMEELFSGDDLITASIWTDEIRPSDLPEDEGLKFLSDLRDAHDNSALVHGRGGVTTSTPRPAEFDGSDNSDRYPFRFTFPYELREQMKMYPVTIPEFNPFEEWKREHNSGPQTGTVPAS